MNREDEVGTIIVDAAIKVHTALGPGLLASVYETALAMELARRGLRVERQVAVNVEYEGQAIGTEFRADVVVESLVLVELKSVDRLADVHKKQTLTYLKLGGWRLGYLLNFNVPRLREGTVRVVNGLPKAAIAAAHSPPSPPLPAPQAAPRPRRSSRPPRELPTPGEDR